MGILIVYISIQKYPVDAIPEIEKQIGKFFEITLGFGSLDHPYWVTVWRQVVSLMHQ